MSLPKPQKPHGHDVKTGKCMIYDPKDFTETKAKQIEEMNRQREA